MDPENAIREESLLEAQRAGVQNIFIPPAALDGFNVIEVLSES